MLLFLILVCIMFAYALHKKHREFLIVRRNKRVIMENEMKKHKALNLIGVGIILLFLYSCSKTPDPNFLPQNLGTDKNPPWETTIYSITEMEQFFADTNYSGLTSIYVSTTGNDNSGDGSVSNPYRTIKYTLWEKATPGTIIRVKAGVYNEETITTATYATKDSPIVLYSQDGVGAAIIDGNNTTEDLFVILGQHVVIDGFEIKNCTGYGIGIFPIYDEDDSEKDSYCVVRNNIVHHTGRDAVKSGLVNFILIENNDISQVQHLKQFDDCIDGVAVYHSICRFNYLHDNGGGTGGYFKGGSANNIWYNNLIKNCGAATNSETNGAGLNIGGWGEFSWRDNAWYEYPAGYQQLVFNNIFINCEMAGISIGSSQKCQIYNNSFYNCGYNTSHSTSGAIIRIPEPDNISSGDIDIFNNVVFNDASHPFAQFFRDLAEDHKTGLIKHGYNTIYSDGVNISWNYPNATEVTEVIANPLFSNPANNDLTLTIGSPAINSGASLWQVLFDYNLNSRPIGTAYDRGAYEQ